LRDGLNEEYVGKIYVKKVVRTCYCECRFNKWENKLAPPSVLTIEVKIVNAYDSAVNFELQVFLLNPSDS
jgi:hypothetical protein